jgi:hypothetical protein
MTLGIFQSEQMKIKQNTAQNHRNEIEKSKKLAVRVVSAATQVGDLSDKL